MKVVTIGKRMLSIDQLAFVEPFDPAANPEFKPEKDFKARVVLLDRDAVLTEETAAQFAEAHELLLLIDDEVAVNRSITYKVEIFEPREGFSPSKPYRTRLKWRDASGADQSKLLVTPPETVITALLGIKRDAPAPAKRPSRRPGRGRNGSQRMEAFRS